MASGFFLGGLGQGFEAGLSEVGNLQYQQGIMKLGQQRLAQAQQNADRDFYLNIAKDWSDHLSQTIQQDMDATFAAHPETPIDTIRKETIRKYINNPGVSTQLRNVQGIYEKLGLDPSIPQAMFTSNISTMAPRALVEGSIARAKESPFKLENEALGVIEKRQSISAMEQQQRLEGAAAGQNPDSPTASTLGQLGGPTAPVRPAPAKTAQATATAAPTATLNDRFTGQQQPAAQPGDEVLARLPAGTRNIVQGIANYDINLNSLSNRIPKGATRSAREIYMDLAEQYAHAKGEDFSQAEYANRQKLYGQFLGGKRGQTATSFNVLVDHLDVLNEAIGELHNSSSPISNQIKNFIMTQTGNPAPQSFAAIQDLVGDELVKAITGGAGALGDRDAIKARVNAASTPQLLHKVVEDYQRLATGQLKGLEQEYGRGGKKDFQQRFLTDRTKQFFLRDAQGRGYNATPTGGAAKSPADLSDDELKKRAKELGLQ